MEWFSGVVFYRNQKQSIMNIVTLGLQKAEVRVLKYKVLKYKASQNYMLSIESFLVTGSHVAQLTSNLLCGEEKL